MAPASQSLNVTRSKTLKKLFLSCFLMQQLDNIEPIKLELPSPILLRYKHKTILSNLRSPTNTT